MNLVTWLQRAAKSSPEATAVFHGRARWASYGELARRAARVAAGLRARGFGPGDRIAIAMPNAPEYLVALYGTWWAGLAAVPVNAKLHEREVAWIVADSRSILTIRSPAEVVELGSGAGEARLEGADPGALAWLFYTSGTTGRPKGAMLSHRNLAQTTYGYFADVDAVLATGRLLHAAPLSHGSGLYNFTHLARGASQVVPESDAFDAAEVLDLLGYHRDVSFFAAPTMVKRLAEAAGASGARAAGLQTIVYGGGPMYAADLERATGAFGHRFAQIYGQGESPMTITALSKAHHADTSHPRHRERLASVGLPHSVVEVAIRDPEGRELPAGAVGEVCVRGDVVMSGYWNNPEATAAALRRGQGSNDIWLWTGDLGSLDRDGFLTLKDRSKDLIVSGGSNIYPREVEEVLLLHPGVAEASVVGRPDPEWGEAVVAFVVARGTPPPPTAELDRLCLDHIARFKRPKEYHFVAQLPKNNYGKVVKAELRAALAGPGNIPP